MVDPTSFHVGLVEPVRQKNQRVNAVAVTLTGKVIFVYRCKDSKAQMFHLQKSIKLVDIEFDRKN